MLELILTTAVKRPYVAAFFVSYLFIAWRTVGWRFTLGNILSGYTIAFASEYLSINYGLPYGWYHYIYENLQGEWLNHGVPVWDSASYVFMSFAGLCVARLALRGKSLTTTKDKFILILASSVFVTLLDVVIDPVAHMGERWFLGKIYYYPEPGFYFDVTLANFIGWFVTSFLINAVAVFVWKFSEKEKLQNRWNAFMGLGLYFGIFAFGLVIAIMLDEPVLIACDLFWIGMSVITLFPSFVRRE